MASTAVGGGVGGALPLEMVYAAPPPTFGSVASGAAVAETVAAAAAAVAVVAVSGASAIGVGVGIDMRKSAALLVALLGLAEAKRGGVSLSGEKVRRGEASG